MFNVGTPELLVILLVALIVLGPDKLPSAARQVGRFLGEFRRMSSGFQNELRDAMQEPVTSTSPPRRSDPVPKATPAPAARPAQADAAVDDEPPAPEATTATAPVGEEGDGVVAVEGTPPIDEAAAADPSSVARAEAAGPDDPPSDTTEAQPR